MKKEAAGLVAQEIFSLYKMYGSEDYIGEPVSQVEHMAQAAELAEAEGAERAVVLAAFFHDIGHLCEHIMDTKQMDGFGVVDHEVLAGIYLRQKGFSERIAKMVESHVEAKRYLTRRVPSYFDKLSEASRHTLKLQGGVMTEEEALEFEQDPDHQLFVRLRIWDDEAKMINKPLPDLDRYKELAIRELIETN
ncbi:MAG: HD domain-containing protein [Chitinophagaceae bacterium]|nr:MAG: HD domain-containing protein [Chitinophagaceae bacterium]